jgi:hypothetical protein
VGGLAQGPDEKRGFDGREAGCCIAIDAILTDKCPSLGKGVPLPEIWLRGRAGKHKNAVLAQDFENLCHAVLRIGNFLTG